MIYLSIIVPVYNEEKSIATILSKLLKMNLKGRKEIIIINDGSTDKTEKILSKFTKRTEIKIISRKENKGKGESLKEGIRLSNGKIVAFQDADLEYDVKDLERLINYFDKEKLDILYGSRFLKYTGRKSFFILGNKFLSKITSIFYKAKITDMETGCKLFRREVIKNLELKSKKFGIEPEITAKILKGGYNIYELPISYSPRKIEDGKKIKYRDGIVAFFILIWYKFFNNP